MANLVRRKTEQDYHDLAKSKGLQWIGKELLKLNITILI